MNRIIRELTIASAVAVGLLVLAWLSLTPRIKPVRISQAGLVGWYVIITGCSSPGKCAEQFAPLPPFYDRDTCEEAGALRAKVVDGLGGWYSVTHRCELLPLDR